MEDIFVTQIDIKKVRHIENFVVPVSTEKRKHVIFTGKNGSGKTSVLNEMVIFFKHLDSLNSLDGVKQSIAYFEQQKSNLLQNKPDNFIDEMAKTDINIKNNQQLIDSFGNTFISVNYPVLASKVFSEGDFIIAFFKAKRNNYESNLPTGIDKIDIKPVYDIEEKASNNFIQYIVNLKAERSFANDSKELEAVKKIDEWFENFEKELRILFDKEDLQLKFDRKDFNFYIIEPGREPYTLTQLSDGYSAILDIIAELIMRMEKHRLASYDIQGVVLIDEIETHLHIELQKKILPFLIAFFPKIQFIVTTHSPFVLNSINNAVICDLEKRIVIDKDFSAYPSEALVEDYFDSDQYSNLLKEEVKEYERLMLAKELTEEQRARLSELEKRFEKISDKSEELKGKILQIKLAKIR